MSLLNDVLRDLQMRGAFGLEPLSGLEPVAEAPMRQRRTLLISSGLAVLTAVSVILMWQPAIDAQSDRPFAQEPSPQHEPEPVADTGARANPAPLDDKLVIRAENLPPVVEEPTVADTTLETDASPAPLTVPATATILRRDNRDPSSAAAGAVTRGLQAMRARNLATAEGFFEDALAADASDGKVWSYLYDVQLKASRPRAAEQTLRQGLVTAQEPAPLAKLYARMLLDRGEKHAAVGILQTHRPATRDPEYDAFLAALLQQQGQYAEAGDIYRQLLAGDENSGAWWIGLAISSDSLGNSTDALSAFRRALHADSLKTPLTRYARRRIAELQTNE